MGILDKLKDLAKGKGEQIVRAVRFLEEGLKAGLNTEQPDELVLNLRGVYDYSIARLTQANFRNDLALIDEASLFLVPLESGKESVEILRPLLARVLP